MHVCTYKAKWTYDPAVPTHQKLVTRIGDGWSHVCAALRLQRCSVARFTSTGMNNRCSDHQDRHEWQIGM